MVFRLENIAIKYSVTEVTGKILESSLVYRIIFYIFVISDEANRISVLWGPKPGITRLDLDSVITRSIERILRAFDDAVQVGLVRLRLNEMSEIFQTTAISK